MIAWLRSVCAFWALVGVVGLAYLWLGGDFAAFVVVLFALSAVVVWLEERHSGPRGGNQRP